MLKKLLLSLIVMALVSMAGMAQNKAIRSVKKVIPSDDNAVVMLKGGQPSAPAAYSVKNPWVGDTIATTTYDIFTNSVMRKQTAFFDGKVAFSPMVRVFSATNRRYVSLIQPKSGVYEIKPAFDTTVNSGWGALDISTTGDAVGYIGVVGHHSLSGGPFTRLALAVPDGDITAYSFGAVGTDPSVAFAGSNIILANSGNRLQFQFFRTTDYGSSFDNFANIATYHPKPIYWKENGGVEVGIVKSANEKYVLYYGTNTGDGAISDGIHPDSADNAWVLLSTDGGMTFTGKTVGRDGELGTAVSGNRNYAPFFENFGQVDFAVDTLGNYYGLANGYGFGIVGTDTINTTPIVFYSSKTAKWTPISNVLLDTLSLITSGDFRPGNGMGQSFPSIASSPDGKVLFAVWTAPQMTNNQPDTNWNGILYTDLLMAGSDDFGASWSTPEVLAGKKGAGEIFGNVASRLEYDAAAQKWVAHVMYLEDINTGASVFNTAPDTSNGVATTNPLIYKKTYVPKPNSVDPVSGSAKTFVLDQNYPNPFNPATTIRFALTGKSNVSLRVFDIMGREVATLVNGSMEAGQHSVSFDASQLASGVYVYRLDAGSFSSSKKMVLMK